MITFGIHAVVHWSCVSGKLEMHTPTVGRYCRPRNIFLPKTIASYTEILFWTQNVFLLMEQCVSL